MNFTLSDQLNDLIISAMDNQDVVYAVDANTGLLVNAADVKVDETNFYKLPEWKPADGFKIREDFVNNLHSPIAKEELQAVLHSGRGVFKNFRNVLKKYPELDKRWHIYKYRIMSACISEWYNSLREVWGLEKLEQFQESEEACIFDDFSFELIDSEAEVEEILFNINASIYETEPDIPDELKSAMYEAALNELKNSDLLQTVGFICRSHNEEFAGCITASPILKNQEEIMVLNSLFVPETFRGLGIATELISTLFFRLHDNGKKWILMPHVITPELLEPLLTRMGFKKIRFGYMAKIL